jgi:hypothetical protein
MLIGLRIIGGEATLRVSGVHAFVPSTPLGAAFETSHFDAQFGKETSENASDCVVFMVKHATHF